MEERHADIAREIKMNREADQIRDAERSRPRASVPWWKRLFRSS